MSSDVCITCKNRESCTFPRNQRIIQCEEYELARRSAHKGTAAQVAMTRKRTAARTAAGA